MKIIRTSLILAAGGMLAAPVLAHHSFSMFDMQKEMTISGTVKEFQWTNPHAWVQILVKGEDGKVVEWSIEGNSPSVLARQGWTKRSLKTGDAVTVTIHPMRDGSTGGSIVKMLGADGKQIGDTP